MLNINFNPFPVLETERLILRNLHESDKYDLYDIRSNPETMQFIPRPLAKTVNDAAEVIKMITNFTSQNERINWAITERGVDKLIGVIGYVNIKPESFRAEVGYVLNNKYTGKGIAYEALEAVLEYGFNRVHLHSVEAIIRPDNVASVKLVEKAGFIREAFFRDYVFHNGRFHDELVYSLIQPDKYRA